MSPSIMINIAHHPTDSDPERYSGKVNPRPTNLVFFSGTNAVPVQSQFQNESERNDSAEACRPPVMIGSKYEEATGKDRGLLPLPCRDWGSSTKQSVVHDHTVRAFRSTGEPPSSVSPHPPCPERPRAGCSYRVTVRPSRFCDFRAGFAASPARSNATSVSPSVV
jgi:hypothetical protein